MTSLYKISQDILDIVNNEQEILDEADETWLEADRLSLEAKFDQLNMDFNEKLSNVCKFMRECETNALKFKSEAVRLAKLAEKESNMAFRMKEYVSDILQAQKIDKLDLDLFKLSFRESASLEIIDESLVPDQFKAREVVETIKIDKVKIKSFLKTFPSVPSVPWVQLNVKQNLQIH